MALRREADAMTNSVIARKDSRFRDDVGAQRQAYETGEGENTRST